MGFRFVRQHGIYFGYLLSGGLGMLLAFYLATSFTEPGVAQPKSPSLPTSPPPLPQKPAVKPGGAIETEAEAEKARANFMAEVESYLEPFIYDPKGRRDPFTPYSESSTQRDSGFEGPLLPLQRFDLNELSLLGIMWDIKDPKAMFKDPNDEIHIVGLEERIGRKNGYVAVIREGEVVIVEASRRKGEVIYTSRVVRIQSDNIK